MEESGKSIDIDSFWEYTDPATSEENFRDALGKAQGDARLELLTQIARTYGLRQRFDEAHEILDEVEGQLADAGLRPQVRYLLERGRTLNSSGDKEKARRLFVEAWEVARAAQLVGLAVDAAHMVAITYPGKPEAVAWNQAGLDMARRSKDSKALALIPAMLNNSAWDLHDMGRFKQALPLFEAAYAEWLARGELKQILNARWAVARCLRSLGRHEEALAILRELEAEHAARGSVDGYVFEEMAENFDKSGKPEAAKQYFRKALIEFRKDDWLVNNEAARLAKIESKAGDT